jgi:hypothetical protein
MSPVKTLAPTLQFDEFEYLKGNLGWHVYCSLILVADDIGSRSIALGVLVLLFGLAVDVDIVAAVASRCAI